jgi:hypothetical protein
MEPLNSHSGVNHLPPRASTSLCHGVRGGPQCSFWWFCCTTSPDSNSACVHRLPASSVHEAVQHVLSGHRLCSASGWRTLIRLFTGLKIQRVPSQSQ